MKTTPVIEARAHAIGAAAAQWRDRSSEVRAQARELLAGDPWPAAQVDAALDNALWDLDESRALELARDVESKCGSAFSRTSTLVFLPGNVLGPALQSAFCGAVAGKHTILKPSSAERHLTHLASIQFGEFDPLAGIVEVRDFRGGDLAAETTALEGVERIIAFGDDATIQQIKARAGGRVLVGYGESYSIAYVGGQIDLREAAVGIARDACLFDQRGCMSPQTVYVAGDPGRALRFTHALAHAMRDAAAQLPRARFEPGEQALVNDFVRRLAATAMAPNPHGLDTLLPGPEREGAPEFVAALEPFGPPTCAGFGRIVVVKPAPGAGDVSAQLRHYGRPVETVAMSPEVAEKERSAFKLAEVRRTCALGDMQRPPFGYRPCVHDFV